MLSREMAAQEKLGFNVPRWLLLQVCFGVIVSRKQSRISAGRSVSLTFCLHIPIICDLWPAYCSCLCQPWSLEVTSDGGSSSRTVIYKLAGCSHIAGTNTITGDNKKSLGHPADVPCFFLGTCILKAWAKSSVTSAFTPFTIVSTINMYIMIIINIIEHNHIWMNNIIYHV